MKKLFSMMAIAMMAFAVSCGGDDDPAPAPAPNPTPDPTPTPEVTALATPAPVVDEASVTETGFTVTWPAVANAAGYKYTVNDGAEQSVAINNAAISGLAAGTTYTVKVKAISGDTSKYTDSAWGNCTGTTKAAQQGGNENASLNGSEYYLISLDGVTYEKIKSKVVADFRVNDTSSFLYWWNGPAFTAGTSEGPNFYNEVEEWTSLIISPFDKEAMTWFGAGFFCNDTAALHNLLKINETNGEGYYLHMAWKSNAAGNYGVKLFDNTVEIEVIVGDASSEYGFARDNEWHEVEVPLTYFYKKGLFYREPFVGGDGAPGLNVMAITQPSDGTWPKDINLDACFIYKK